VNIREAVEDPTMRREVDRKEEDDLQHHRRLERSKRARSKRDFKARTQPSSSESKPRQTEVDGAQDNVNEHSTEDEHLDVIAEEGTSELLRTEGAAVEAVRGEYAEGEKHNTISTPGGSPTDTLRDSPEEVLATEGEEGFPFEEEVGTEVDVEEEGEKRRSRRKKLGGGYAGWIGSKRGERVQREIYV